MQYHAAARPKKNLRRFLIINAYVYWRSTHLVRTRSIVALTYGPCYFLLFPSIRKLLLESNYQGGCLLPLLSPGATHCMNTIIFSLKRSENNSLSEWTQPLHHSLCPHGQETSHLGAFISVRLFLSCPRLYSSRRGPEKEGVVFSCVAFFFLCLIFLFSGPISVKSFLTFRKTCCMFPKIS